jgi:hypothetical protein
MNTYQGIGYVVSDCCVPVFSDYRSFDIRVEGSPAFLVPYITDYLAQAMVDQGLTQVAAGGDVLVTVTYDQTDLVGEVPKDQFEGHLAPGGDFRFNAAIDIMMHAAATGELIWSARLSRIHNFYVGEYMHKEKGTAAIYRALVDALKMPKVK